MSGQPVSAELAGAGFYGKVASQGDFILQRLPPAFVQRWDTWLQEGIRESRMRLGPRWLPLYLNSPVWRFALAPGVCGPVAVAGVLVPSVDCVGRHFPLTVAAVYEEASASAMYELMNSEPDWFDALADLALLAMDGTVSVAAFDAALVAFDPPALVGSRPEEPAHAGQALFWTDDVPPVLHVHDVLPPARRFGELLGVPVLRAVVTPAR